MGWYRLPLEALGGTHLLSLTPPLDPPSAWPCKFSWMHQIWFSEASPKSLDLTFPPGDSPRPPSPSCPARKGHTWGNLFLNTKAPPKPTTTTTTATTATTTATATATTTGTAAAASCNSIGKKEHSDCCKATATATLIKTSSNKKIQEENAEKHREGGQPSPIPAASLKKYQEIHRHPPGPTQFRKHECSTKGYTAYSWDPDNHVGSPSAGPTAYKGQRDAQFYTIKWSEIKHQKIVNLKIESYRIIIHTNTVQVTNPYNISQPSRFEGFWLWNRARPRTLSLDAPWHLP